MQRATWTDERLDDLSRHMDSRFEQADRRFDRLEDAIWTVRTDLRRDMGSLQVDLKSDIGFVKTDMAEIRASVDRLNLTLTRGLIGVIVCLIGVLAATAIS